MKLADREQFVFDYVAERPFGVTPDDRPLQAAFHAKFGGKTFTVLERVARILSLLAQTGCIERRRNEFKRYVYYPRKESTP